MTVFFVGVYTNEQNKPFELINPLTSVGDQDRISPYYINTISCRQVMRIKKNINDEITN